MRVLSLFYAKQQQTAPKLQIFKGGDMSSVTTTIHLCMRRLLRERGLARWFAKRVVSLYFSQLADFSLHGCKSKDWDGYARCINLMHYTVEQYEPWEHQALRRAPRSWGWMDTYWIRSFTNP